MTYRPTIFHAAMTASFLATMSCVIIVLASMASAERMTDTNEDRKTEGNSKLGSSSHHAAELQKKEIRDIRKQASEADHWKVVREMQLVKMKKIFSGEISAHVDREKMANNVARMKSLMAQWNPIHTKVKDLKTLVGEPTSEEDDRLIYVFDLGWEGAAWAFNVRNDKIVGVERLRID